MNPEFLRRLYAEDDLELRAIHIRRREGCQRIAVGFDVEFFRCCFPHSSGESYLGGIKTCVVELLFIRSEKLCDWSRGSSPASLLTEETPPKVCTLLVIFLIIIILFVCVEQGEQQKTVMIGVRIPVFRSVR